MQQIHNSFSPIQALRALAVVMKNPQDVTTGAKMVYYLSGHSEQRLFDRFKRDPMGATILSEGRRLEKVLCDRDYLAGLPLGTLGREYHDWMEVENLTAQGILDSFEPLCRSKKLSDDDELIDSRSIVAHDIWHVVTGYGRDLLGEAAIMHFMIVQAGNTGLRLPAWLSLLAPIGKKGRKLAWDARRRAREAAWLPAADWEKLLTMPLNRVREQLRLIDPPIYEPVYSVWSLECNR